MGSLGGGGGRQFRQRNLKHTALKQGQTSDVNPAVRSTSMRQANWSEVMELERDRILEVSGLCDKKLVFYEHPLRILIRGNMVHTGFCKYVAYTMG